MCFMYEPRSKDWYDDEDEAGSADTATGCSETILAPLYLLGGILLLYLAPVLILLGLIAYGVVTIYTVARKKIMNMKRSHLALVMVGILIAEAAVCVFLYLRIVQLPSPQSPAPVSAPARPTVSTRAPRLTVVSPTPPASPVAPSHHTTTCQGAGTFPSNQHRPAPRGRSTSPWMTFSPTALSG